MIEQVTVVEVMKAVQALADILQVSFITTTWQLELFCESIDPHSCHQGFWSKFLFTIMTMSLLLRCSTRFLIKRSSFRPIFLNVAHFTTTIDTPKPTSVDKKTSSKINLLLDMIPGETKIRKSICFTTTAAIVTYLIKSGIYIVNHETLVLIAFYLAMRWLYLKVGPPIGEYLQASIDVLAIIINI